MASQPSGVLVCFRKYWGPLGVDPAMQTLFPWYDRAVLGVILPEGVAVYECRDNPDTTNISNYSKRVYSRGNFASVCTHHHLLQLQLSPAQCRQVYATCEACVQAKLRYNHSDLMLSLVPLRNPIDLPIDKVKSVRNVQAVVLILRECLDPSESELGVRLRTINSRTINPTGLEQLLAPSALVFSVSRDF